MDADAYCGPRIDSCRGLVNDELCPMTHEPEDREYVHREASLKAVKCGSWRHDRRCTRVEPRSRLGAGVVA